MTTTGARVAGVILAAGRSSRMGRNKLLLELGGETVVGRAVRRAAAAGLDPVVVVTGHDREGVERALAGAPCETVHNPDYMAGPHTSVSAGIGAVAGDGNRSVGAAVVILADMPWVTAAMLRELASRHRETGAPVVASRYDATLAPPVLYARRLFHELLDLDGRCGKRVVRRHRDEAVFVDWPAAAMRDLDVPADYAGARRAIAARRAITVHG